MFKVIKCGEQFSINGVDAPYFPMLVNIELEPDEASLYEVNSYLRSFATKRKGVEKAKRIAAALCRFFNYHYYIRVRRVAEEIVAYTIIDESIIKRYQEWLKLKSDLGEASSRNTEIKYIYHFYWHLEHKVGAISGVEEVVGDETTVHRLVAHSPGVTTTSTSLQDRIAAYAVLAVGC